jgi:hypothetical protein
MPVHVNVDIGRAAYPVTTLVDALVLGADTAESYTVPANVNHILVVPTAAVWYRVTSTAAVPAADITDGSSPVYIAAGQRVGLGVSAGMVLSFIRVAGAATTVTISRYEA